MEHSIQLIEILVALVGVLGLFYLIVKFIKSRNLFNQTNQIKVLERCHLGQNQVVYLVKVVDDIWVVTSTEQNIQFVREVDPDKVEVSGETKQSAKLLNLFRKAETEDENNEY